MASVFVVSAVSIVGIFTLAIKPDKLQKILFYVVSFAAGALFGDAFLHLLPEAISSGNQPLMVFGLVLLGIAFSFILEKFIRWRHCHVPTSKEHPHPLAMMNLVGDSVHNFLDGTIIAASYILSFPAGLATSLAVIFHEIPQEIGDFGVLLHSGLSTKKALLLNFLVALTAFAGAIVILLFSSILKHIEILVVPFSAGMFIYIAGSDLIPELHKRDENFSKSLILLVCFAIGVSIMAALLLLE